MSLEDIIERYRSEIEFAEEYALSEDSALAEYVKSFQYGEADALKIISDAEIADETKEALTLFWKKRGDSKTLDLLSKHSSLSCASYGLRSGEIFSEQIGEQEHQPDDELMNAFLSLSPKDRERVQSEVDAYVSDNGLIYNDYSDMRFVLILDEAALMEELDARPSLKIIVNHDLWLSRPNPNPPALKLITNK